MKNQIRKFDRSGSFFPSLFDRFANEDLFRDFWTENLPATNVTENDKSFAIDLSIPGFSKEDVQIEVDKNILTISAKTETKNETNEDKVLRREFQTSSFTRRFTLPENVDTENISASEEKGILHILLPKLDKAIEDKVKRIEIK
ncbi:Hsp20/alpha crystallin family protein [Dysgonomonas massiliensis]|uniref:Hsp20/alpha crystallin family protein n=1 Tax=Dysgonomonas massiliensis TaxID=2040292 RepID=UPI000C78C600|nr:Hsp20/alpha crystallin family protein [Dysgonomonas massiliensis]